MTEIGMARRYAKALFGLLNPAEIDPAADILRMLADTYGRSREFRALLHSPLVSKEQQASVVSLLAAKAAGPPMIPRFLAHLVKKGRMAAIREISQAFTVLADRAAHRTTVALWSARPLSEEDRAAIKARLERVTQGTVNVQTQVDPALLGGLKIQIHSTVYDGTLRGQLDQLRAKLATR